MKTALRHHYRHIDIIQIRNQLLCLNIDHRGTQRYLYQKVITALARTLFAHTWLTRLGAIARLESKIHKSIKAGISLHKDAAAIATITTVRAAPFDVFLTAKAQGAIATLSGLYNYFCFVYKFHVVLI